MGKKSSQGQAVESADTTRAQNPLSDADGAQAARKQRSPAAHQGIQVNFCKNPICANFGSPVGDKLSRAQNPYRIVASGKGLPVGYCQSCTESFPLKSNKGIHEELERMLAFLVDSPVQSCCPVEDCSNHAVPVPGQQAESRRACARVPVPQAGWRPPPRCRCAAWPPAARRARTRRTRAAAGPARRRSSARWNRRRTPAAGSGPWSAACRGSRRSRRSSAG